MRRCVRFSGQISLDSIQDLLEDLKRRGSGQQVLIRSPGGAFEFFSDLAPQLIRCGFESVGQNVASAAIILHMLGSKRYALPHSTFFFHEVRSIVHGSAITVCNLDEAIDRMREYEMSYTRETLEEWRNQMRNAQNWMISLVSSQSGIPPSTFLNLMRAEATLSAREAVHYGIAHRIMSEDEFYSINAF